jgi:ABC-type branched-subunit amino acid transport system substrate-binding protein
MTITSKQDVLALDSARINGVTKVCMSQASILVDTVAYTPTEVIAIYQDDLDAQAVVEAAESALAAARAKAAPVRVTMQTFDKAFKRCIEGAYGSAPDTMSAFGMAITVPRTKSAATKAIANVKAQATRAVRHTMGPVQKAAIAPAQIAVTLTTEPAPSAASAPTSTTPSGGVAPAIVAGH